MIVFALFICVTVAQTTPQQPANNGNICSNGTYFDINDETGKCNNFDNCLENVTDGFTGCVKCNPGYYRFGGSCRPCNCGYTPQSANICIDEVGCVKCNVNHIMAETTHRDGTILYSCVALPERVTVNSVTEIDLHGPDTRTQCTKWGDRGCVECNSTYYVNGSMCYNDTKCNEWELTNKTTVGSNVYYIGKCKKCYTPATEGTDDSYYLLDGRCVKCDPNCISCEQSTGYCKKCHNGYYPDGPNSRKCYPCDPHCGTMNCTQLNDTSGLAPGSCKQCDDGYYLISNKYCFQKPTNCAQVADNKGCTACDEKLNTHFLVPYDFRGKGHAGFAINKVRIGMCVPHQDACPLENRTATGCTGCSKGYVLDKVTWTGEDGKQHSIGICSGASSLFILALIAFLALLF